SSCAEAHAVLGFVAIDGMRMKQGMAEYRHALSLDPNSATAHQWYGISLLLDGKPTQAYDQLREAADLNPESVAAADWLSQAAFIARRYKDAIAYGRQALDLSPARYGVYSTLGMAYEALGDYPAAIASYKKYAATCTYCSFDAAALLAHVYAITHDDVRAQEQLKRAERGIALRKAPLDDVAVALAAMGRKDDAMAMLRKATHEEPGAAGFLAVDPRMDALRGDARFRQVTQGPG
ncbi:MAG TPA: tetratricopeptide repeat protein, partial [Candidatus Baltobacteraceae bacterium]|nr:tetratricopeptide repeat protein [Candidatus Baltobacteraceae bacterium]